MTENEQQNQPETAPLSDKELNFRRLESKYQKELAYERAKREEIEKRIQEYEKKTQEPEEDDDAEPYVDHKKLEKKLNKFAQHSQQQTQNEIKKAVQQAIQEERKQNWIKNNPDFYDVLQHAEALALQAPDLAESILEMPDSFERQKLVYKNIKVLGLDKPKQKEPSIQEKIDLNRRSPFYQPSNVAAAPYSSYGNFSESGQKQAYEKMKELQSRLRL